MNDQLQKDLPAPPSGAEQFYPHHQAAASLSSASGASHHTSSSSPLPSMTTSPPLHHASLRSAQQQQPASGSPRSAAFPLGGAREAASDLAASTANHQQQQQGASALAGPPSTSATTSGGLFSRLYITLVRHAESEDNASATWAGAGRDAPLTGLGKDQARALGGAFADVRLEGVYASDLLRAKGTAEEVVSASRFDPKPPLVQARALREQHFGTSEGRPWKDVAAELDPTQRSYIFPEGESLEQVNARVASAVRRYVLPRLESLASSGARGSSAGERVEHIMIVSHGITTSELLRVFLGLHNPPPSLGPFPDPRPGFKRAPLDNTGWTRLELAVPLPSMPSALDGSRRESEANHPDGTPADAAKKHIVVRVMEQNNIDHLVQLAEERAQGILYGGDRPLLSESNALGLSPSSGGAAPGPSGPSQRTLNAYDGRFVLRELERAGGGSGMLSAYGGAGGPSSTLGNVAATSSSSGAATRQAVESSGASSTGHGMAPSSAASLAFLDASTTSDAWQNVCVRVLPLFNGEGLRSPIEELNEGVSAHIRRVLDRSPARALQKLAADLTSLLSAGMYTLNARLPRSSRGGLQTGASDTKGLRLSFTASADDLRLLSRLTEVWTFYYGSVVPYLEGCFLPLETDPVLLSLTNDKENSKAVAVGGAGKSGTSATANGNSAPTASAAASSSTVTGASTTTASSGTASTTSGNQGGAATAGNGSGNGAPTAGVASLIRTEKIDVRSTALRVFRDGVVLPLFDRLVPLLSHIGEIDGAVSSRSALSVGHELAREELGGAGNGDDSTSGNLDARRRSEEESSTRLQPRLLQLTSVLCAILSSDAKQDAMDALRKALRRGSSHLSSGVDASGGAAGTTEEAQQRQQGGPAFFAPNGVGSMKDLGSGGGSGEGKENRRGWIPRSAAKHGIMAEEQRELSEASGGLRVPPNGRTGSSGGVTTSGNTTSRALTALGMTEDDYLGQLRSPTVSSPGTARVGRSGSSGGGPRRATSTGRARSEPDSSIDSVALRRISGPPQIGRMGTYDYVPEGGREMGEDEGIDGVSMAWLRQQEALRRSASAEGRELEDDPNAPSQLLPPMLVQTPEEDSDLSRPEEGLAPPSMRGDGTVPRASTFGISTRPSLLMPGGFGTEEGEEGDGDADADADADGQGGEVDGTPIQRQAAGFSSRARA